MRFKHQYCFSYQYKNHSNSPKTFIINSYLIYERNVILRARFKLLIEFIIIIVLISFCKHTFWSSSVMRIRGNHIAVIAYSAPLLSIPSVYFRFVRRRISISFWWRVLCDYVCGAGIWAKGISEKRIVSYIQKTHMKYTYTRMLLCMRRRIVIKKGFVKMWLWCVLYTYILKSPSKDICWFVDV